MPLDRDRFEKCRAMWKRGATDGEKAAGKAAAERVAASAGMTLQEAITATRGAPRLAAAHPFKAWAPPIDPEPTTVAEAMARKAEDLARMKRAARRAERAEAQHHAEWADYLAEQREAQAERDRAWAESRRPAETEQHA